MTGQKNDPNPQPPAPGADPGGEPGNDPGNDGGGGGQEQTFSQADVDRIVDERLKREREQTKKKYADYNDLKKKAEESRSLEDRVVDMEKRTSDAEAKALRAEVANAHGISAEDRDLFLTGTDTDTLTAQAKRLSERTADQKRTGNRAPREGGAPKPGNAEDAAKREFAREFFGTG